MNRFIEQPEKNFGFSIEKIPEEILNRLRYEGFVSTDLRSRESARVYLRDMIEEADRAQDPDTVS